MLLHGFTGGSESWAAVARGLDDGNGVVAVALPGHHPEVPVAADFEGAVDAIAAGLARAGLAGIELVGYSLGARLALGLALRHRGLAARLTLIGVNPGIDEDHRAERRRGDQRWASVLREQGIDAFAAAWQDQPIFASQRRLPARILATQQALRRSHDPEALAASLETMGLGVMPDYRGRLRELEVPTRLVVGALDVKFLGVARDMIRRAPALDLEVIADCGHNPLLERPAELARVLRRS